MVDRVSKPTNGAPTRSINPECPSEQAAVECEDVCFLSSILAYSDVVVTTGTVSTGL